MNIININLFKMILVLFLVLIIVIICIFTKNTRAEEKYLSPEFWDQISFDENTFVDYPLVFVHGLAGNLDNWQNTIEIINENFHKMRILFDDEIYNTYDGKQTDNIDCWNITYYNLNPLEEALHGDIPLYAKRLESMIEIIKNITGKDKVIIIAHSMGGLVARKYMILNENNWNSVHKLLTVGTPHKGVAFSPGLIKQLENLEENNEFIENLNSEWNKMGNKNNIKRWGVIGGIKDIEDDNRNRIIDFEILPGKTDAAGPGFVRISSAIPLEWEEALNNIGQPDFNTKHYGFRLALQADHRELLEHHGTLSGIYWALKNN